MSEENLTTVTVTTPAQPAEGTTNEDSPERLSEETIVEEVNTVADEILVEVKECRSQQGLLMADLARLLREDANGNLAREQELLTEIKNLREEQRNLNAELKALLESHSSSLTPLTYQPIPEPVVVVNPVEEEGQPVPVTKKRTRYRI